MKPILAVVILSSLAVMAFADLSKIQGKWTAVSGQIGAIPMPKATVDKIVLKIIGETYDYDEGHGHDRGTLKAIDGDGPKAMDIVGTDGPNKGKVYHTIFKIEKSVLTICYGLDGKRPSSFEANEKSKTLLMVYHLAKER